jgi:hypothetical protein
MLTFDIWSATDQNSQAFKEVAIIRHPRVGEYALGFITSSVVLQVFLNNSTLVVFNFRKFLSSLLNLVFHYFPMNAMVFC